MNLIKSIHVLCAYATGLSFLIRGMLVFANHPFLQHRAAKVLPHILDTVLLLSGISMAILWSFNPSAHPWLLVKIALIVAFIFFGIRMLRCQCMLQRCLGFIGGIFSYCFIVYLAHSKANLLALL